MGVRDIATALRRIDAAVRQGGDLRSAVGKDLRLLYRELDEARAGHAEYSTQHQIDSLLSELDRAESDDHRLGALVDFLIGDEIRLKRLLTSAEREDSVAFYKAIEEDWRAWKARMHEREGYEL